MPVRRAARAVWNRFSLPQLVVMALAAVAPSLIAVTIGGALLGLVSTETMLTLALAAGENPGMITFGAMFLCSPVQWATGRSQVRVRKYLGIVFFLLALSNGAMFVVESGIGAALGAPFLVAGSLALVVALPLFLTSSRRAQRSIGLRRWRRLHRATYLVAAALVAHVVLVGDVGLGFVLISLGTLARIPAVRRRLVNRGDRARPGSGGGEGLQERPGQVEVAAEPQLIG